MSGRDEARQVYAKEVTFKDLNISSLRSSSLCNIFIYCIYLLYVELFSARLSRVFGFSCCPAMRSGPIGPGSWKVRK